jgi:starch phosphorylase
MKTNSNHFSHLPERIARLGDMAYNIWFSWHSEAVKLFRHLDQELWENVQHNPVHLLYELDPARLIEAAGEEVFLKKYDHVVSAFGHYMDAGETWFTKEHAGAGNMLIAYFSMEFGVHECLPIYSGGLGILSGDHLKSASDLGIPMAGIGLLYRESYFTQFITTHGHQQSVFQPNDFSRMALKPVLKDSGEPLTLKIQMDHGHVAARVWLAQIARVPLYLLDTDVPENTPEERKITRRLYVSDRDLRLVQELVLGIGGVMALNALGLHPTVWHLNEGHCAFSVLERIRILMKNGIAFDQAIEQVRRSTVFTTHTPVAAGNEVFEAWRMDKFFQPYWESMGLGREQFFRLAQEDRNPDPNAFNMTILSLKLSNHANAVSQMHGQVAKRMWSGLWPDRPAENVPIDSITNGIHTRTWMASEMKNLLDCHIGLDWRYQLAEPGFWGKLLSLPDEELWKTHHRLKFRLIEGIRQSMAHQRERNGEAQEAIEDAARILNPDMLTVGFARRFTPYKRASLLFRDRERLKRILTRDHMPVQIVFAGKAHPADQTGKSLIEWVYAESRNPEFSGRIVFVENYDIALARRLVSGVDVWLNVPRRPHEASGTSGMKAAVNGAINMSILDGWWREGYNGKNGWAIGEDRDYYNEMEQDEADSNSLYHLLENEVAPLFYKRDSGGLPVDWLQKMKESMRSIIPVFNTNRMLKEYTDRMYIPSMNP